MNSVMVSQPPSGAVISARAVAVARETTCLNEGFALGLYVIGAGSLDLSFAISAVPNRCVPSKFLITTSTLDCCGG